MEVIPVATTEQRLDRLEARVAELAAAFARLESKGAHPQLTTGPEADEDLALSAMVPNAGTVLTVLSGLGTSFLVLGGAFLIRTITDAGAVPRFAGIAAGFLYAIVWIVLASQLAKQGRRVAASFLGITAVVIGDPLLFETVTRFHAVGPWAAAVALAILTGACVAAARRRDLAGVAWVASLAGAGTAAVLSVATGSLVPFAAALLAIAVAVVWMWPGAGHLSWDLLRWPAAGAADAAVLAIGATLLTADPVSGALRGGGPLLVPLSLALPVVFIGSFAVQVLWRHREVGVFEVLQTFGALAAGTGAAVIALRAQESALKPLGAAALVLAACFYIIALETLERRTGSRRNVLWAASVALAVSLFGSALLLPGGLISWSWLILGAGCALASSLRPVLRLHAAAFVTAAAWQSGLISAAVGFLILPATGPMGSFSSAAFGTLAAAALCVPMIARPVASRRDIAGHIGRIALSVIACLGACGLLVFLLRPLAVSSGSVDPAAMALIRSAVIAAAAVCLALLRKRTGFPELGWLAYALVVMGGLKLVLEDVPAGRALTLFLAFGFYGTALLWLPRILRAACAPPILDAKESFETTSARRS